MTYEQAERIYNKYKGKEISGSFNTDDPVTGILTCIALFIKDTVLVINTDLGYKCINNKLSMGAEFIIPRFTSAPETETWHMRLLSVDVDAEPNVSICECGSDKVGSSRHSSWCPKNEVL